MPGTLPLIKKVFGAACVLQFRRALYLGHARLLWESPCGGASVIPDTQVKSSLAHEVSEVQFIQLPLRQVLWSTTHAAEAAARLYTVDGNRRPACAAQGIVKQRMWRRPEANF